MMRSLSLLFVAGVIAAPACRTPPDESLATSATGPVLAVPGRANAHVSLASDGSFVAAVWAASLPAGGTDIYAAVSVDGGTTFSTPVAVSAGAGDAIASGEQPPRIALARVAGRPPGIFAVWLTRRDGETTLTSARSEDGGRTFSVPSMLPGSAAPGNRGWQTVAVLPEGQPVATWLDHRQLAPAENAVASPHQHGGQGGDQARDAVAMAQLSQLYFGPVDGSASARPLTGGVCYCCKTAMGVTLGGAVAIAWRHVYPGNLRDIAFVRSEDGGRTFGQLVRVSEDRWAIAGCPDDGPAMAIDGRDRVHLVWPTVVEEGEESRKVLFHAMSTNGTTFSPRVRIPTEGHAAHPNLAVSNEGELVAVWDEAAGGSRRVASARGSVVANGTVRFEREQGQAAGVYPAVVYSGRSAIIAWTEGEPQSSVIRVRAD